MGLSVMINLYTSSFINIDYGIQNLKGGGAQTHSMLIS
jgi:hypothetical protein